jgi:hypothetical protein
MSILTGITKKFEEVIDAATTPAEKQEDAYNQLVAKLPDQRAAVARVIGGCSIERQELSRRQAIVADAQAKLAEAKQAGASDATLKHLADVLEGANNAVNDQQAVLTEYQARADEARASLDQSIAALEQLGKRVVVDKTKSDLADAIRAAADAKQAANEIHTAISDAGQHSQQVQRELEEARAANQLVGELKTGPVASPAVQAELDRIGQQSATQKGRAELEQITGGQTEPAATTPAVADKGAVEKGRAELGKILSPDTAAPKPATPAPAADPKAAVDQGRQELDKILGGASPEKK